jgi:hypothetical protein
MRKIAILLVGNNISIKANGNVQKKKPEIFSIWVSNFVVMAT